jgi:predicted phosphate transport protein (TIGR00153 family)
MKLDRFIKFLLPHDETFFSLFEESAQNLSRAASTMKKLAAAKTKAEQEKYVREISDCEHAGDSITHKTFSELNGTFVTPFDREDIHLLASSLDEIMDQIDGSARRFYLYKLKKWPPDSIRLIEIIAKSIAELQRGITLLRNLQQIEELQKVFKTVNEYENEADTVFEEAMVGLFGKEKDPFQLIKLKEVYVGLETATDSCEDVANVLETIVIKHA